MPTPLPEVDRTLHDSLVHLVREHGPLDLRTLARRARLTAGRPAVDETTVSAVVATGTLLVERPDGRVTYLGDVLDGIVLTHRVRGSLRDRTDLWLGRGVQPFLAMAVLEPLPLASGGEARLAETPDPVLLGPDGWLPPAEHGDLVALQWSAGQLHLRLVDPAELPGPAEEDGVRRLLSAHCRTERWWSDGDEDWVRNALLLEALGRARLEDPQLLSTPHTPLDQLLYDPLSRDPQAHWRDTAALRQADCVSFFVEGMPFGLDRELRHRAERYGMTFDQFLITLLGHLAWRTPFAEDLEPWEDWWPEEASRTRSSVTPLRLATAAEPTSGGSHPDQAG
ncbi:hypothetical protein [Nocardioides sp. URHA0032]|uniref:hypothetical protein n=1 Tax=Nocardioides sp. URHA0032 TaxID=1380388 RepID=UPI00048AA0BA|nr:hypothetical protein [Nocardioides sp. URHA0032]